MVVININFYYSIELILKGYLLSFRFEHIWRKPFIQTPSHILVWMVTFCIWDTPLVIFGLETGYPDQPFSRFFSVSMQMCGVHTVALGHVSSGYSTVFSLASYHSTIAPCLSLPAPLALGCGLDLISVLLEPHLGLYLWSSTWWHWE
jgi:hypothetical protein